MNWYKTSQISNYLPGLGYSSNLISFINSLPKERQKLIGHFINNNPGITENQLLQYINSNNNTQNNTQIKQDLIFKSEKDKNDFFSQIPKEYQQWVFKILNNKEKRPEDLYYIQEVLKSFSKIKKLNIDIKKDINQYSSFRELQETCEKYNNTGSKSQGQFQYNPLSLAGVELYSNSNGYTIYKITDAESLSLLGLGTKWCTRKDYPDCQSKEYINSYGSIYIVSKNNKPIIQFTPDLDQVMDINDNDIENLPKDLNIDKIILEAVKYNGFSLRYASEELKNNPNIVLEAVKNEANSLSFASEELRNNPTIVLEAVKKNAYSLQYASLELKNNPTIVLEAVNNNINSLQYASEELRNDPTIMLEVVRNKGNALYFASEELKNNPTIVLEAVKNKGHALLYASPELKNNPTIVLEAVKNEGHALYFASKELKNNPTIVLEAIKQYRLALQDASEELRNNPSFMNQVNLILNREKVTQSKNNMNWYKTSQKLTPEQVSLYTNFKSPSNIKIIGNGTGINFQIPGTNQSVNGLSLMNQVVSRIKNILIKNNVHTIDTSSVSGSNVIGLAVSSEPGTIHVDIAKILNFVKNQSLPSITQLDGTTIDKDLQGDIISKVSNYIINQIGNTAAHESFHNNDYFNSFPKGRFESSESSAENYGNQVANSYFKL